MLFCFLGSSFRAKNEKPYRDGAPKMIVRVPTTAADANEKYVALSRAENVHVINAKDSPGTPSDARRSNQTPTRLIFGFSQVWRARYENNSLMPTFFILHFCQVQFRIVRGSNTTTYCTRVIVQVSTQTPSTYYYFSLEILE